MKKKKSKREKAIIAPAVDIAPTAPAESEPEVCAVPTGPTSFAPSAPPAQAGSADELRRDYPYLYYGAHAREGRTAFRVHAPEATEILLLREGNGWGSRPERLERDDRGDWSIEIPENLTNAHYKYLIKNHRSYLKHPYEMARIDPFSRQLAVSYGQGGSRVYNSVVTDPDYYQWQCPDWTPPAGGMAIYELHLGTFQPGNYREMAEKIVGHVGYLGFSHVQIMPPFQTPIYESWGYLVGCPYALSERHGTVDDFKYLVDRCHQAGLGVIVDVPLGFGVQDWDCGLGNYDGADLYHHAGPRGWNNQWQTRNYNHCSPYVRDYLAGICTYLHRELKVDGARIDAVSAQLFFDYDRGFWDWPRNDKSGVSPEQWEVFNSLGGDRHFPDRGYWLSECVDFDALFFFRDFHKRLAHTAPHFITIAEDSRRVLPRLAVPVDRGGLGFTYAQNMGEMHRIRKYLTIPVAHRKIEHIEIILQNPHEEEYVNPINTHDECANGKTRLITELGSHLQLIGLAALNWFRPGAPMLFQGDEFAEEGWFNIFTPLDWGKTGPGAKLHQQQMTANIHDLNQILRREPALGRRDHLSYDRIGSNNEHKWFSFIRWGGLKKFDSGEWVDHRDDLIFVRNEAPWQVPVQAELYVPVDGEYQVIYNSIDERYIGQHDYNRHNPYWSAWAGGRFLRIELKPYQNLALKLKA